MTDKPQPGREQFPKPITPQKPRPSKPANKPTKPSGPYRV